MYIYTSIGFILGVFASWLLNGVFDWFFHGKLLVGKDPKIPANRVFVSAKDNIDWLTGALRVQYAKVSVFIICLIHIAAILWYINITGSAQGMIVVNIFAMLFALFAIYVEIKRTLLLRKHQRNEVEPH